MPPRRKLRVVSREEWWLLCLSMTLVVTTRAALWVLPSRSILRVLGRLVEMPERTPRGSRPGVSQIAWAIDAASRRVPQATCLTQAIAGQLMFRRYGYASRLCVGVQWVPAGAAGFRAHAWIERDGRIVIGGSASRSFTPLEFPTRSHLRAMVNS
jgi:hypothetical protein